MLDIKNLNEEQEVILQAIWEVCQWFHLSRGNNLDDAPLARQAMRIGSLVGDFERAARPKVKRQDKQSS